MEKEIEKKLLSIVPEAEDIMIWITGGYGTHETGNITFTTKELNGKRFSIGLILYSRDPLLSSFTCSKEEIIDNLSKFK